MKGNDIMLGFPKLKRYSFKQNKTYHIYFDAGMIEKLRSKLTLLLPRNIFSLFSSLILKHKQHIQVYPSVPTFKYTKYQTVK